jgi:hypothetical protein
LVREHVAWALVQQEEKRAGAGVRQRIN